MKIHLLKACVLAIAFVIVSTLPSCISLFSGWGDDDDDDDHRHVAVVRTTTPVLVPTTTVTRY